MGAGGPKTPHAHRRGSHLTRSEPWPPLAKRGRHRLQTFPAALAVSRRRWRASIPSPPLFEASLLRAFVPRR